MRSTIFFILLIWVSGLYGQEQQVIAARIVDNTTKVPLEFVNIRFEGKELGTTTTKSGHFILSFNKDKVTAADHLQISFLGYETRRLTMTQLKRLSAKPITIALTPAPYSLSEVLLKSAPREKKTIGHTSFTAGSMGYWEGKEAIGGEIASVIQINKERTKLHGLAFNILQNASDSIQVRVKIYSYLGGEPLENLTTNEILRTISSKKGLHRISLEGQNIIVDKDVLISIQLVEAYGPRIYFALSASAYGGTSFIRQKMHPYWQIQKTVCVGFKVESSFPNLIQEGGITKTD